MENLSAGFLALSLAAAPSPVAPIAATVGVAVPKTSQQGIQIVLPPGEYLKEATRNGKKDFSEVFKKLSTLLHSRASKRFRLHRFEQRAMFSDLVYWTERGAHPTFQKREDLALHFIHGGFLSSRLGYRAARKFALEKEKRDANEQGNAFDLDDYAATLLGARWAVHGSKNKEQALAWYHQWAAGKKTLSGLAPLRFGKLPPGKTATRAQLDAVETFVNRF